jgi:hypothetical protein
MITDQVSIVWKPKIARVSQVFGKGVEYALVSADNRQIHQFVYCKDFLQDTIHAYLNATNLDLYAFRYDGAKSIPVNLDSTKLLIASYRDPRFKQKIDLILEFLNQFEDRLKMRKTVAYSCKAPMPTYKRSGVFMLEGSKRWMKAPPLISLYTFLIRLGCSHTVGDPLEKTLDGLTDESIIPYQKTSWNNKYPDQEYLKEARIAIDWVLKYGDRRMFYADIKRNYPRSIKSFDDMHNHCGLVGLAKGDALEFCPYWYRLVANDV